MVVEVEDLVLEGEMVVEVEEDLTDMDLVVVWVEVVAGHPSRAYNLGKD